MPTLGLLGCVDLPSLEPHQDSAGENATKQGQTAEKAPASAQGAGQERALLAGREEKARAEAARREAMAQRVAANQRCQSKIESFEREEHDPGTPKLDRHRAQVLARVKGEPVLFERPPEFSKRASRAAKSYRAALAKTRYPWDVLRHFSPALEARPELGRAVMLREGYLYAETPGMARALYEFAVLDDLFDDPELVLERGPLRLKVTRDEKGKYHYADGPEQGDKARLLLFDRVLRPGEPATKALHFDARGAAYRYGFDRMKEVRSTEDRVFAEVRYGNHYVPTLFGRHEIELELDCEVIDPEKNEAILAARERHQRRQRALRPLRQAMVFQVREKLPFDEPKTEWGQQDGHLLSAWEKAYSNGEDHYTFNFDRYDVFTEKGAPNVPQVCIDFVTHTFERASGTWWRPRGEPRERVTGKLDLDPLIPGSRRQIYSFLDFVKQRDEAFEVKTLPLMERVPYQLKYRFYEYLAAHRDDFVPGDVVMIRGYAPWDHYSVPHSHAFFVYESDPVTGMPILLAGNAGKPRIRSWEPVMGRTPLRSIRHRLRPKLEWLERVLQTDARPAEPPPLVSHDY